MCSRPWRLAILLAAGAGCGGSNGGDGATPADDTVRPPDSSAPADAAAMPDATMTVSCAGIDAAGAETWCGFAQAFFTRYCDACHDATDPTGRDWTQYPLVKGNAMQIECGVTPAPIAACASTGIPPRQFPIGNGPKPTDAERTRLINWIQNGTPQ